MRLNIPYLNFSKDKSINFHKPKTLFSKKQLILILLILTTLMVVSYLISLNLNTKLIMSFESFTSKILEIKQSTKLKEIHVIGRENISKSTLLKKLKLNNETSITNINISSLKQNILSIGWVKDVIIERRMPHTLIIKIAEYKPFALLQMNDMHIIINSQGRKIAINNGDFNYLPVINGVDSEKHAAKFLNILSSEPNLFHQVWAITYIGKRRWNISLRSGVKIKLPEKNPSEAWAKLSEIDRNESLLSREIDIIDLRKDGYIIIKPSKKLSIERST